MVAYVFQRLLNRGAPPSRDVSKVKDWFADNTVRVSQNRILRGDVNRQSNRPFPGRLCMFTYKAKGQKTLPYYDKFPLVFPIEIKNNGFMGLNLHYLPPPERAKLMDALWPCIKHYLNSNVMSRFVQIDPSEWNMALFLPTERFVGRSKNIVFEESLRKV